MLLYSIIIIQYITYLSLLLCLLGWSCLAFTGSCDENWTCCAGIFSFYWLLILISVRSCLAFTDSCDKNWTCCVGIFSFFWFLILISVRRFITCGHTWAIRHTNSCKRKNKTGNVVCFIKIFYIYFYSVDGILNDNTNIIIHYTRFSVHVNY